MLIVNNLTKNYGDFVSSEYINLEFSNEVYALLLTNGSWVTFINIEL